MENLHHRCSTGLQVFSKQNFNVNKRYHGLPIFFFFFCIQLFPAFFIVQVFQSPGFSKSRFFRVQVFLSPGFSGSRLFRVQVFQGSGPGSGSRVWLQVLEVAELNEVGFLSELTLKHNCSNI